VVVGFGAAELANLAVYVLGSLFPEPVAAGSIGSSAASRPNPQSITNIPKAFSHSLPSPPLDTPPASPAGHHFINATSYSHSPSPSPSHSHSPASLAYAANTPHVRPSAGPVGGPTTSVPSSARSGRSMPPSTERPASASTGVSLYHFIEYTLVRTRLAIPTFHKVLLLLTKLKSRYPRASGTSLAGHRLFVAGAMLACGMDMDDAYRRSSWVEVCRGMFTSRQLSQMETEVSHPRPCPRAPLRHTVSPQ